MINILKNKTNLVIAITVLWNLISVGLMATGVWSSEIVIFNTLLLGGLFILLRAQDALGLFLLCLPFMVVIPNSVVANLPMWRPLAVFLFFVILIKYLVSSKFTIISTITRFANERLASWDKWLYILGGVAVASLLVARFPEHGAKQILFLLNIYLIYLCSLLAIENTQQKALLIRYVKASLLFTIALGFLQYGATLFSQPYYFWQYWAQLVSALYYGLPLAEVLSYSNSWFSANGSGQSLRMFGILQDTHAFGVIVIFALALWLSKINFEDKIGSLKLFVTSQNLRFWIGLVLLCFAVVASGTRGIWVAMMAPLVLSVFLIYKFRAKWLFIFSLISYGLVIILFILYPWISTGLNWIRTVNTDDNFLDRATSIYDLNESSNVGRLEIWQASLGYAVRNPLGSGYGNFIVSISNIPAGVSYEEASSQKDLKFNLPEKFVTAHSSYLHILVELGIVGLVFFLGLWFSWVRLVWVYLKSWEFKINKNTLLITNLAMAIIWLLAYGLFDVTILNERVLLYLMTLLAIINLSIKESKKQK